MMSNIISLCAVQTFITKMIARTSYYSQLDCRAKRQNARRRAAAQEANRAAECQTTAFMCMICLEEDTSASATTACGHRFCTSCLCNNIAQNVGTVEGTTRNKCPICRSKLCEEVIPSMTHTVRLGDLEAEKDDLSLRVDDLEMENKTLRGKLRKEIDCTRDLQDAINEMTIELEFYTSGCRKLHQTRERLQKSLSMAMEALRSFEGTSVPVSAVPECLT
jgi:hypothetical protein